MAFDSPVTVRVDYSAILNEIGSPELVGVVHWDDEGTLADIATLIYNDVSKSTLEFKIQSFSNFGIVEIPNPERWAVLDIKWAIPEVGWYIDLEPGTFSFIDESTIEAAFRTWAKYQRDLSFKKATNKSSAQLIFKEVGHNSDLSCDFFSNFATLGGLTCFDRTLNFIESELEADNKVEIELASEDIRLEPYASEIANWLILHEIGHALGLAHPYATPADRPNVMYPIVPVPAILHPWDIAALQHHYGTPVPEPSLLFGDHCATDGGLHACATVGVEVQPYAEGTRVLESARNLDGENSYDNSESIGGLLLENIGLMVVGREAIDEWAVVRSSSVAIHGGAEEVGIPLSEWQAYLMPQGSYTQINFFAPTSWFLTDRVSSNGVWGCTVGPFEAYRTCRQGWVVATFDFDFILARTRLHSPT